MDIDGLKRILQNHVSDGLVVIVGAGLSTAEGLPGMNELALHLVENVPPMLASGSNEIWHGISKNLENGVDLETALSVNPPNADIEHAITSQTAQLLSESEKNVFEQVLSGNQTLRFSRLLRVLRKEPNGIPVITTNYDRLIELAAEAEGLGINSTFVGHRHGRFDQKSGTMSLCKDVQIVKKKVNKTFVDHVRVIKPHGSLDWYHTSRGAVRCSLNLNLPRLMITPGGNKYQTGYKPPFDAHISNANTEIDRASRFLILGYGFNDEHLQTHITGRLENGDPAIIVTKSISSKTMSLLKNWRGTIAITKSLDQNGTSVLTHDSSNFVSNRQLWDLGVLVEEVWKQ